MLVFVLLVQIVATAVISENNACALGVPVITVGVALNKRYYKAGESIKATCKISNISRSKVWLPPLQIVDIHFSLYKGNIEILPFDRPCMTFYGLQEQNFISLMPDQVRMFNRIIGTDAYSIPFEAGEYRLCISYENHIKKLDDVNLWVGKTSSCVPFEIK